MVFHKEYNNSMDSGYLNVGYYLPSGGIAATTSIQTPNQIAELAARLNLGVKNVEISGPLDPNTFQQVPIQHFEELRRAAKLSDAKLSLHAPMIDIVGFSERGEWTESERKLSEGYLKDVLTKAARMDVSGNIPVTIHTNRGIPGFGLDSDIERNAKETGTRYKSINVIDQESGRMATMEYEKKQYPGKVKIWTPEERLQSANQNSWDEEKLRLLSYNKEAEEIIRRGTNDEQQLSELEYFRRQGVATPEQMQKYQDLVNSRVIHQTHLNELNSRIHSAFNELYHKYSSYSDKKSPEYIAAQGRLAEIKDKFVTREREVEKLRDFELKIESENNLENKQRLIREYQERRSQIPTIETRDLLVTLPVMEAPNVLISVDDFAKKKASDTISNAAIHAYTNLGGENAPTLAVENWHPETVLSRGENFRALLDDSREKFVNKLVEKGVDKDSAKRASEKLIGATWDVSHINMLKRFGYSDKEIASEVEAIAKPGLVKKIHLADNFGYGDTHLVPGMGNAPIKEQLSILSKYGALDGAQQVLEAGAFDAQFKESSLPYALEAFNSPLYSHNMEQRWANTRDVYGSYNYGFGDILPDLHFSSHYGSGFSNLPKELGGQINGDRSRFSGTPNE